MHRPSFNLIEQPFIPCVMQGELVPRELSLAECLERAHEIREINDDSPLVTVAIHRLLLAILHRNFGPSRHSEWKALWERGQFDAATLEEYFREWQSRFDLFDDEHPFLQSTRLEDSKPYAAARLVRHVSQTYTDTLFNHTLQNERPVLSFAEAARHLIVEQSLAMSGGKGYVSSPSSYAILFLATGRSLFETLLLNLVRYDDEQPFPHDDDRPTWERDDFPTGHRPPRGYLEYLTWQPREIRLLPISSGVQDILYAKGPRCELNATCRDPMLAYRTSKTAGVLPHTFTAEKSLWRDSSALLMATDTENHNHFFRPGILDHLADLASPIHDCLDPSLSLNLKAFGILGKKASIQFWRAETLPLPLPYLTDHELVGQLQKALTITESTARLMRSATQLMAAQLLSPSGGKPDPARVSSTVQTLAPERPYWSRLEQPFRTLLGDLADHPNKAEQRIAQWAAHTVRHTAVAAFDQSIRHLDSSARTLRAVSIAQAQLTRQLHKLISEYDKELNNASDLSQTVAD